ncbi:MAG: hypothetical protein U5J64_01630 [Halobacteriales archaeon]|nr:hypothetical protein [Halobacteriales archaeon]
MSRKSVAVTVLVALALTSVLFVGTAGALSVSFTQDSSSVSVEVTENGEPVEGATVSVSGVSEETPLDGEYVTDSDGKVVFEDERLDEISGIVNLRLTVEYDGSFKSAITTLARSPEVGSPPMGQRMSMSMHKSVAGTRGTIESRLNAERASASVSAAGTSEARRTAEQIDEMLVRLDEVRFERQALGRNLATGDITVSEFYLRLVENAGEEARLVSSLRETVRHLSSFDEARLRENGVDTEELDALLRELDGSRQIDANQRLTDDD